MGEIGKHEAVAEVTGQDLIGCFVKAPLTPYDKVPVLPMLSISTEKVCDSILFFPLSPSPILISLLSLQGTGIVTCVPSDSPDDYSSLMDLKTNAALREKFGVKEEWVVNLDPISIIEIPGYGQFPAAEACWKNRVTTADVAQSFAFCSSPCFDFSLTFSFCQAKEKLAVAKQEVYQAGFYKGAMKVGKYAGM